MLSGPSGRGATSSPPSERLTLRALGLRKRAMARRLQPSSDDGELPPPRGKGILTARRRLPAKGKGRTFAGRRPPPGGQGLARGEGGLPREGQGLARRGATPRHEGRGPPPRRTAPSRDEEALPHDEQGPSRRDEGPHPRGMTRPAGESPVRALRDRAPGPADPSARRGSLSEGGELVAPRLDGPDGMRRPSPRGEARPPGARASRPRRDGTNDEPELGGGQEAGSRARRAWTNDLRTQDTTAQASRLASRRSETLGPADRSASGPCRPRSCRRLAGRRRRSRTASCRSKERPRCR